MATSYQSRFKDTDAAREGALADMTRIADAKGWSQTQRDTVTAHIKAAYEAADDASWFGYDVGTFWRTLFEYAKADATYQALPSDSGKDWGRYLDAAVIATGSVAEGDRLNSWWGMTTTFAEGVAEDVTALRDAAGDAAEAATDLAGAASKPTWMIAAAAALIALVVLSRR